MFREQLANISIYIPNNGLMDVYMMPTVDRMQLVRSWNNKVEKEREAYNK